MMPEEPRLLRLEMIKLREDMTALSIVMAKLTTEMADKLHPASSCAAVVEVAKDVRTLERESNQAKGAVRMLTWGLTFIGLAGLAAWIKLLMGKW